MGFSDSRLNADTFVAKRDVFAIGGAFRIMDAEGNIIFYSRQKLFKLKEDIRIFDSKGMEREVLNIKARHIIDFSAAYDVLDSSTQEKVGVLRRRGFSSMFRDHWEILDKNDLPFASIREDSSFLAFIRRWLLNIIPQTYIVESINGQQLGIIKQRFNPFIHNFDVDFSASQDEVFDRRLCVASVILLLAIEGRQQ